MCGACSVLPLLALLSMCSKLNMCPDCASVVANELQKKLGFDFNKLRLRLGPKWFEFQLKPGQLGTK